MIVVVLLDACVKVTSKYIIGFKILFSRYLWRW